MLSPVSSIAPSMFLYKVGSLGSLPLMLLNPFGRNPIRDAPRTQWPGSFSGEVKPCTTSSAQRPASRSSVSLRQGDL